MSVIVNESELNLFVHCFLSVCLSPVKVGKENSEMANCARLMLRRSKLFVYTLLEF